MAMRERHPFRLAGMDRINDFSDAVFAVAITLLIQTIDVPEVAEQFADQELPKALADMWPKFFGYALSFVIVGTFWMMHHPLFSRLKRVDKKLMWLNHFFLMFIVFLSFHTEMMGTYEDSKVATAFYAVVMAACSLLTCTLWWYSTQVQDLSDGDISRFERKDVLYSFLAMAGVFALSLAIVPFSASAAKYSWISIWPLNSFIGRKFDKLAESKAASPDPGA